MIRKVEPRDVKAITDIYNGYISGSTATFETEPLEEEEMRRRIEQIAADFPYYVAEEDGVIAGYCYAHLWKERAAYSRTLETTVYLAPSFIGKGVGRQLMTKLVDECRLRQYHALIACITEGNEASITFHLKLGFRQVSDYREVGRKFDRWLGVSDYERIL